MTRYLPLVVVAACMAAGTARADERIGPEIPVGQTAAWVSGYPRLASDGVGTFVAWADGSGGATASEVMTARIDGSGAVTGPVRASSSNVHKENVDVASDGHGALVVWEEHGSGTWTILGCQLTPAGTPIDAPPFVIAGGGATAQAYTTHVAFDGIAYRVVWLTFSGNTTTVYTRRVGRDGALDAPARRIRVANMTSRPFEPRVACRGNSECLVTWTGTGGVDQIQGVGFAGDTLLDREVRTLLRDAYGAEMSTSGTDYLLLGTRSNYGCGPGFCGVDAVAGRVSAARDPLDLDGFLVNHPTGLGPAFVAGVGLAFDGTQYVAGFLDQSSSCAFSLYAARITSGGQVLDPDAPGLVIHDGGSAVSAAVAATRTHAVVGWADYRLAQTCAGFPAHSVYAQRAVAHADVSGFPTLDIGAIGPQSVHEEAVLGLTLNAPGLNPATTVVAAANVPPGGVFDSATRTFRWRPAPDEAGTYPGIHFEASDGVQTVTEDITVTVVESSR